MSVSHVRYHIEDESVGDEQKAEARLTEQEEVDAWNRGVQSAKATEGQTDAAAGTVTSPSNGGRNLRKRLSTRASSGLEYSSEREDEEAMGLTSADNKAADAATHKHQRSPYLDASLLTRLSYRWLSPFMALGSSKVLEEDDMHELMPHDSAVLLMEGIRKAQAEVMKEQQDEIDRDAAAAPAGSAAATPTRRPRVKLLRMLWKQFGWRYLQIQSVLLFYSGVKILQPLMLFQLVSFLSTDEEAGMGYLYAIAMGLGAVGQALVHHQFFFHAARSGDTRSIPPSQANPMAPAQSTHTWPPPIAHSV